jgi:hypothetical protein
MKFLIVSFDGLRPDLISAKLTPNNVRVQQAGMTLSKQSYVDGGWAESRAGRIARQMQA